VAGAPFSGQEGHSPPPRYILRDEYPDAHALDRPSVITVAVLIIVNRPVFYLKRDVSETRFCFRLQVKPQILQSINQLGSVTEK
jgi:hypothetical protein